MPPLPHPQAPPHLNYSPRRANPCTENSLPASFASNGTKGEPTLPRKVTFAHEVDEWVAPPPPPPPHSHPLNIWKPNVNNSKAEKNTSTIGNTRPKQVHRISKSNHDVDERAPTVGTKETKVLPPKQQRRSSHTEVKRLDTTFLDRDRITAFLDKENSIPTTEQVQLHSTRFIKQHIEAVQAVPPPQPVLEIKDKRHAATEASQFRPVVENEYEEDHAHSQLERARMRKVKKQLHPRWLQTRQDSSLRPRGPLDRPEEQHYYEKRFQLTYQDLVNVVQLDRDSWPKEPPISLWTEDLSKTIRSTTPLYGSSYDLWNFQ